MKLCSLTYSSLFSGILWITLGFLIGAGYRATLNHVAPNTPQATTHNINSSGRIQRAIITLVLIVLGFCLNGNPLILIAAGFTLFEVVGSWCVVNAMLGKNECDL